MQARIQAKGSGPGEYAAISYMTVDRDLDRVFIADLYTQRIYTYDYQGEFIESIPFIGEYPQDLTILKNKFITIMQCQTKVGNSGLWISDEKYNYMRHILDDVPPNYDFDYRALSYNHYGDGIYYYDRNRDYIYDIRLDTVNLLYQFKVRQELPPRLRKIVDFNILDMEGFGMLMNFTVSENYVLLLFSMFDRMFNSFRWVCLDRKSDSVVIAKEIKNDIDQFSEAENFIFYVDNKTICRVLQENENEYGATLQFMHLK